MIEPLTHYRVKLNDPNNLIYGYKSGINNQTELIVFVFVFCCFFLYVLIIIIHVGTSLPELN